MTRRMPSGSLTTKNRCPKRRRSTNSSSNNSSSQAASEFCCATRSNRSVGKRRLGRARHRGQGRERRLSIDGGHPGAGSPLRQPDHRSAHGGSGKHRGAPQDCPAPPSGTTIAPGYSTQPRTFASGHSPGAFARESGMGKKIVVVGTGAVGGYTGAHMAKAGEDLTFIDFWPEHVETIKRDGLTITHHQGEEPFAVRARALHLTEVQHLSKEAPVDIAFICTKSYDTALGGADDPAISGADRLCRVAAELHERGDDRRDRRLGKGAGLHRQQYQRRARRAGPYPSRRAEGRRGAHGLSLRRSHRPHHRAGAGSAAAGVAGRQRHRRPTICGASAGRSW